MFFLLFLFFKLCLWLFIRQHSDEMKQKLQSDCDMCYTL